MRVSVTIVWLALLSGCVTTVEGPLPPRKSDPERVYAQIALARGYMGQDNLARARPALDRALAIDPRSVEAIVMMAELVTREGEYDLAEDYYRRALRIDADHAMALNNYGAFLYDRGRPEEAIEKLRRATRDTGYYRRAQAYENLGLAELKAGVEENAEIAFQRALMLNAGQARSDLELATIYYERKDFAAAKDSYEAYIAIAPQIPRSLWLGIQLFLIFDDSDRVASYALALKNRYPGSREYRLYQESLQ